MVALQIRDVPEPVRDKLVARAQANGQSLQAFLLDLVTQEASFVDNLELIRELNARSSGSSVTADDVLAALDEVRAERAEAHGIPMGPTGIDHPERRRGSGAA
jgi:plasmid stability protein